MKLSVSKAKAEFMNPGGSAKDRIAAFMVQDAIREGKLQVAESMNLLFMLFAFPCSDKLI